MYSAATMESIRSKTLPFIDIVIILQSIVPYDLFPSFNRSLCMTFRGSHDQTVSTGEFLDWLNVASQGEQQREAIYDRLVGHLAMHNVGLYDQRWALLRG